MIDNSALNGKLTGGMLAAALTSVALAASTLSSAPAANATCASFFGIGNSAQCTSTLFSAAIAVGTNAQANAAGLLGAAFAFGNGARAESYGGFGLAATAGTNSTAAAVGAGNIAVNIFGDTTFVGATGLPGTVAVNLFGNNNTVVAGFLPGSVAFNAFGSGNTVRTIGGLALAGSILQNHANVNTAGILGLNINGIKVGGAATIAKTTARPAATTVRTANKTETTHAAPGQTGGAATIGKKTAAPTETTVLSRPSRAQSERRRPASTTTAIPAAERTETLTPASGLTGGAKKTAAPAAASRRGSRNQ